MKRFLCITLAILMISAFMVGCKNKGAQPPAEQTVVVKVSAEYVDAFADDYAKEKTTAENGDVQYTYTQANYDKFLADFAEHIQTEVSTAVEKETIQCEYTHCYYETHQLVFGVTEEAFADSDEEALKQAGENIAKIAIKYDMNTKEPTKKLEVVYRSIQTSEDLYTFTYSVA